MKSAGASTSSPGHAGPQTYCCGQSSSRQRPLSVKGTAVSKAARGSWLSGFDNCTITGIQPSWWNSSGRGSSNRLLKCYAAEDWYMVLPEGTSGRDHEGQRWYLSDAS